MGHPFVVSSVTSIAIVTLRDYGRRGGWDGSSGPLRTIYACSPLLEEVCGFCLLYSLTLIFHAQSGVHDAHEGHVFEDGFNIDCLGS